MAGDIADENNTKTLVIDSEILDLVAELDESTKDSGKAITIHRRGKVVARSEPASSGSGQGKPWEELCALGYAQVKANESAWADEGF